MIHTDRWKDSGDRLLVAKGERDASGAAHTSWPAAGLWLLQELKLEGMRAQQAEGAAARDAPEKKEVR